MWTRSRSLPHRQVLRAKIVLLAADGVASDVITERLGCNHLTVRRWRRRFSEARVEGLEEAGARGQKPQLSRDFMNRVLAATMEAPKDGSTHWSARRLGARFGVSHSTVLRIWKDHGLQPHRSRSFKFSLDPARRPAVPRRPGVWASRSATASAAWASLSVRRSRQRASPPTSAR